MNKLFGFGVLLALLISFGACKPKQSAYQSVYEAAKEREMEENSQQTNTVVDKPAYPVYSADDYANESVRTEKITPVNDADA